MSSHSITPRLTNDFYPTPDECIDNLLTHLDLSGVNSFTEPCRGDRVIYDKINVDTKHHAELSEGVDYLTTPLPKSDLIITNPPFSLFQKFVEKSLKESNNIFYLLRLSVLESKGRKDWWEKVGLPTNILVLSSRPKFIRVCKQCKSKYLPIDKTLCCGKRPNLATDSAAYAWFCWVKDENILKNKNYLQII